MAQRAAALLEAVHARPGLTRAAASQLLGIGTGAATGLVARLAERELLAEEPAPPTGSRGRPTRRLTAHPAGPLVLAAAVSHESWRVEAVELGGRSVAAADGRTGGQSAEQVLGAMAGAVTRLRRRLPGRVRGLGVSVPGTVRDGHTLDASYLGWRDIDLRVLWPGAPLFAADNDATLAALAESRRGAAAGAALSLHVLVDAGIGGAIVERGQLLSGARGVAGEFGHMPFGDPAVRCPCGARGCWGTAVDGTALARLLGAPAPRDSVTYTAQVLARAAGGHAAEAAAVAEVTRQLGRGLAGLVNALDPDLVTLGGLAAGLAAAAPSALADSYRDGLMSFRRDPATPVVAAELGDAGPRVGAAEQVWTRLLPALAP
jgi:predicted NBD/HSP70 family sugar kinase